MTKYTPFYFVSLLGRRGEGKNLEFAVGVDDVTEIGKVDRGDMGNRLVNIPVTSTWSCALFQILGNLSGRRFSSVCFGFPIDGIARRHDGF